MNTDVVDSAGKKAIQDNMIALYFARPRKDSPKRFLSRLLKPKAFRFQSLLRGAMRSAAKAERSHIDGCKSKKRFSLCKCSRIKANARKRERQGRPLDGRTEYKIALEGRILRGAEVRTK